MKYIIFLLVLLPALASADCPNELNIAEENFCIEISWDLGEKKLRGNFESVEIMSPYLIEPGEMPQKWVYSQAIIKSWKKGDSSKKLEVIQGFRVFPYMHMTNGHHHSAGYDFYLDTINNYYVLRRIALKSMNGCWSLRWTNKNEDKKSTSQLLINLVEFTNLTDEAISQQGTVCDALGDNPDGGHKHDHHHH